MPSAGKKWMCPNHPDHVMPRRRTLQENLQIIEVVGKGQSNNGNIEIANDSDGSETSEMEFEDTIINRKKFRVPEKVIRLDFWERLKKERDVVQTPVAVQEEMSADEQDAQRAIPPMEDLNAAAMMMALAFSRHTHHTPATPPVSEPSSITSAPIQQLGESSSGPARAEKEKSAIDTPPSKSNSVLKAAPFLSLRPTQSWTPAGSRFHNPRTGHAPSQSQPSSSTPSDSSKTSPKSPRPIQQSSILSPTSADVTKSAQESSLPAMLPIPPSRPQFEPPSTIRFALPPKPQSVSSASMSQTHFSLPAPPATSHHLAGAPGPVGSTKLPPSPWLNAPRTSWALTESNMGSVRNEGLSQEGKPKIMLRVPAMKNEEGSFDQTGGNGGS
ncbi:uncharacterized protein IAS62_002764 [Cryptococcus decagattii]|uniref:Uncharacterized protein n=1 Tax=Cryptococcus decagattii TaxID=1859122 RepID=A0ABZ2ASF4_9TREE